ATMNPRAFHQQPITVDDVLASPMEASPLHKLDCCLVTDGAGAVVLTSADQARDLAKAPAYVLGTGTSHDHMVISQMPDLTVTAGGGGPPVAGRRWSPPGRRSRDRRGPRLRRGPVVHVDRRPRNRSHPVKSTTQRFQPPISDPAIPFWDATRDQKLIFQWCPS